MADAHRTVAERAQVSFEVQGSQFIGHVAPVDTVDEAEAFIDAVGAEYDDATHNVPAYRVLVGEMVREYSSDAGEPTGSAGKPALNVLTQRDLSNVVSVVTRYYGGTNLGVGGLARAYSRAVKETVDEAGVVEEVPHEHLEITVEYDDSGTVRGILESEDLAFEAVYGEQVSFDVRVPFTDARDLQDRIRSATSGRADIRG